MNKHVTPPQFNLPTPRQRSAPESHPSTQGAQDWHRLAWTLDMFDKATDLGLFAEEDHIELIRGELVPMASRGNRHERVRYKIAKSLRRRLGTSLYLEAELGWRPGDETYLEPDILVFADDSNVPYVPVDKVRLLIDVAHSSLNRDLGLKTALYAGLGVPNLWVVNAVTLEIHSHDGPSGTGYARVVHYKPTDLVTPPLAPELALRMSELGIDPFDPGAKST